MTIPKKFSPPVQAVMVFTVALVFMLIGIALDKMGIMEMERLYPWSIATGFMLMFAIFNSIASLQADNVAKYWGASMYSYIGLGALTALSAWQLSGVALSDAESYKFIYVVVTIGFLVFISMINLMKKIVNFAEKEEWNEPRKRR